jgi:hypothetical protein
VLGQASRQQEGREPCGWLSGARAFHEEETASAKALRQAGVFGDSY